MLNNRGPIDTRLALTGKDGALYSDDGTMLATCESFQTQVNVTNAKYQPLGDAQEHEVFQSYGVTLTFTEVVVTDERFISELFDGMVSGNMPSWNFQGVVKGRNGSEQRMNSSLVEYVNGIQVIKAFGRTASSYGGFSARNDFVDKMSIKRHLIFYFSGVKPYFCTLHKVYMDVT